MIKLINYFFGIICIMFGMITFMFIGSIVDGISIATFLKWACFSVSLFTLGIIMYHLSEVNK